MTDLFDAQPESGEPPVEVGAGAGRPLADRLRPQRLDQVLGQQAVLGPDAPLGALIAAGALPSLILWGPPGVGKTTIARLVAATAGLEMVELSAIFSGVAELKKVFETARLRRRTGKGTLLFVDEIHRFNKAQQDAFLPNLEDGTITLIGATTENPSFELNPALLSRAQVIVLQRLDAAALAAMLDRAEAELGRSLPLDPEARAHLVAMADGDGRALLNMVEVILSWGESTPMDPGRLAARLNRRAAQYDKSGEGHYNLISALHKSVRGSDPDAALYWFARMLEGGEDPRFLARRLTRMAVEDVGLADPQAQGLCLAAWQSYERLGSPEGELALAEAVIYLALAPKSNAGYRAYSAARALARQSGSAPPPKHILNAPTRLMKEQGYGAGYAYDHDAEDGFSGQDYFPEDLGRPEFYAPVDRGFERDLGKRLEYFARLRARRQDAISR